MTLRIIFQLSFFIIFISCRRAEKSNEVMKEAMKVYLSSELFDSTKTLKSLELTNRALELNDQNIPALTHKTTLLFRLKDIEGLIQTVDQLIKLRPGKPYYLGQKALYLELKGDETHAKEYYDKSLSKYLDFIKTDSQDFNLMMEYVGMLQTAGDTTRAKTTLERMEDMNFNDSQKQMIDQVKRQSFQKEQLKRYFRGEIEYDEIAAEVSDPAN